MLVGNGKRAEKTKGKSLNIRSVIMKGIVKVKAGLFCLAHALIITIARVNGGPKYKSY